MPPTRLVLFSNPNAGTPLRVAAPTAAIGPPTKMLVREDGAGNARVAWNDPAYRAARHAVSEEYLANIAAAGARAAKAAAQYGAV